LEKISKKKEIHHEFLTIPKSERMKKVVVKVVVAIAVGVIAGQIAGYKFQNEKYFAFNYESGDKIEISEIEYDSKSSEIGDIEVRDYTKETSFNTQQFYTILLCVSSGITILLLIPELREPKN
jgi:hypothetical protein